MSRKTPLLDLHKEVGGSIGTFADWSMPIDYGNMLEEALTTRKSASFFDISHLYRILVRGSDASHVLQHLLARDIAKLGVGEMSGPTAFLNHEGGFKDDVVLYRLGEREFMVVGNAANHDKIVEWMEQHFSGREAVMVDITFDTIMIALQGPDSIEVMSKIWEGARHLPPLTFSSRVDSEVGKLTAVSRSGWTGEPGYEIIAHPHVGELLIRKFIEYRVKPAGLGARDILRVEMGFCLYGNEIDEGTNPLEAKYWVFSWKKREDYIGKRALCEIAERGVEKIRMGLLCGTRSPPPRKGDSLMVSGNTIGYVTSGTFSPGLNRAIGIAYVNSSHALEGFRATLVHRGRSLSCKLTAFPFIAADSHTGSVMRKTN